jgi:hypothetical protein
MADQEEAVLRVVTTTARPRRSRRVKLKSAALNNVPQDVHSDDAINVILLLAEANIIDIEEEDLTFNFLLKTRYEVNKKGRLIELTLGNHHDFWNVPRDILSFNSLDELNLCNCGRLSNQFDFPNLKLLVLSNCGDQMIYQPMTVKLPKLTSLALSSYKLSSSNIPSLIFFISKLPPLDFLYFKKIITNDGCMNLDPILQILQNEALLSDRLRNLVIKNANMILLLEVLPRHTKLHELNLLDNHIESLQPVIDGINEISSGQILPSRTTSSIFNNHITHILLDGNPVVENTKKGNREKKTVLTCLRHYKRVYRIASKPLWSHPFDTEIVYALRMNEAGRILLVDGGTGTSGSTDFNLPLSVWPTVSKRALDQSLSYT